MTEFVYDGESVEYAEEFRDERGGTADIRSILNDHWQEYARREAEYGGTPSYEATGALAAVLNDGDDDFGYDIWDMGHFAAEGTSDMGKEAYRQSIEAILNAT